MTFLLRLLRLCADSLSIPLLAPVTTTLLAEGFELIEGILP